MKNPKVSVIIPCYNTEKYLNQCLDSVAAQTLQNIEIICVDDGSTDRTPEILLQYAARDTRFTVLTQENKNAGAARNNGLQIARGEYLSFLDADDFFEPEMLEKMVESADQYMADFVVCHSDQYLMDRNCLSPAPWVVQDIHIPPYMPFTYRQLTDNVFRVFTGWAWDKLYRRSFLEKNALFFQEQRTTNDLLFVYSALVLAERIAVIEGIYAHQRRGSRDSLSVTREKSWHCFYDALIALRQRLIDEDLYWELERDYINYALHFSLWHLNTLAEPTHQMLEKKLQEEWFRELGITDKPDSFFTNSVEFAQYKWLMGREDITREEWQSIQYLVNGTEQLAEKIMSVNLIGKIAPHIPWSVKQNAKSLLNRILCIYHKTLN